MTTARTISDAIRVATNWITHADLPFASAFIGGSAAYASPASDIDCYLVVNGDLPEGKIGKFRVEGVLLDVSWLPWQQVEKASEHAILASLLHFGKIVIDRTGQLTRTKQEIDSSFASSESIAIRLEDMRARIRILADPAEQSGLSTPEQVMNWLFPATLATHIPLVRACAPLTVRKRFMAAKKVMNPADYEELLSLYGFDIVTPEQARSWLDDTALLFDHAAPLAATSNRFWATDIIADARSISIVGSQELIDEGAHREALYWIVATQARCLTVMHDARADVSAFLPAFERMTHALAIGTASQRAVRTAAILDWIDG